MSWVATDNVKYFNMIATYGQKEDVKFCVNGQKSDQLSQNPDKVTILKTEAHENYLPVGQKQYSNFY